MMKNKIRIIIIDDIAETRENIKRLISLEEDLVVIGEAGNAESGIDVALDLKPDIILMDINLPGMDGLKAAELLTLELPASAIIMISVQEEQYYMKQAMAAGAREFLMKPFTGEDLMNAVRRVYKIEKKRRNYHQPVQEEVKEGQVLTIFSGKGGVGKTTISVNLAIALAQQIEDRVVVIDLDLQFGDVALMMDLNPDLSIVDLAREVDDIDEENGLGGYLTVHESGVDILAAPSRPEEAEMIQAKNLGKIIQALRKKYQYVIIDTKPAFHDINLVAMDLSDRILLITALELATVKNNQWSLQVMEQLGYQNDKIHVVLNRYDSQYGLSMKDLERTLHLSIKSKIPSDGSTVVRALNTGEPFVLNNPKASITKAIIDLAKQFEPKKKQEIKNVGFFHKMKKLIAK